MPEKKRKITEDDKNKKNKKEKYQVNHLYICF